MLQILGDLLPYAVAVSLSPLPIIATVMLLLGRSCTGGAAVFVAARLATAAVASGVVAALAGEIAGGAGAERGAWIRVGLGVLLVAGAAVLARRPRGDGAAVPGWMRAIEAASPAKAARLGVLLTVVNVKELGMMVGAGVIIGAAGLPLGPTAGLALVFAALAVVGAAAPLLWALAAGERAAQPLAAARDWLMRNQTILVAGVLLLLGVMLIGSGIEAL